MERFNLALQELECLDDCDQYLRDRGIKNETVPLLESIQVSIEKEDKNLANKKIGEFLDVFLSRAIKVEEDQIGLEPLISNFQPKLKKILKELDKDDG